MKDAIMEMLKELRPEYDFAGSADFIGDGLLDSFDIISLVSMLEEKYGIKIDALEIVPENFQGLGAVEALVVKSGRKN